MTATCELCERDVCARGLCRAHYAQDWARRNPEKRKASRQRWVEANSGRQREAVAAWGIANAERHIETIKTWKRRNRSRVSMTEHRRRARLKGNGVFTVTDRDLRRMLHRYRYACAYCERRLGRKVQWDHVLPIARGGRHSVGNLLPVCAGCNARKSTRLLIEYRTTREAQS